MNTITAGNRKYDRTISSEIKNYRSTTLVWCQGSVKLGHTLVLKQLSSTRVFETLLISQSWVVDRKYNIPIHHHLLPRKFWLSTL